MPKLDPDTIEAVVCRVREAASVYGGPDQLSEDELPAVPLEGDVNDEHLFHAIDKLSRRHVYSEDPMLAREARLMWLLTWATLSEWRRLRYRLSVDGSE